MVLVWGAGWRGVDMGEVLRQLDEAGIAILRLADHEPPVQAAVGLPPLGLLAKEGDEAIEQGRGAGAVSFFAFAK